MATGWKRLLEIGLVGTGLTRVAAGLRNPRAIILAYHNIVPSGEPVCGDSSLHLPQETFARQLDFVGDRCDVVPLDQVLTPNASGRPRVAITFDDAYRGALTAGLSELSRRDLPSTVFVAPGLLGCDGFWWDLLADAHGGVLPPGLRTHYLDDLAGRRPAILERAERDGLQRPHLPAHALPVTEDELLGAVRGGRMTIGSHTWDHPNLAALTEAEVDDQLESTERWLNRQGDAVVDWLAYPYGLNHAPARAVASRRHRGSVTIDGGLALTRGRATTSPDRIPRVNVTPGMSLHGLEIRLAGLVR